MGNEREISLIDLFWRILFGWKPILVLAVIFALLGGLYSYKNYQAAPAPTTTAIPDDDLIAVNRVMLLENSVKDWDDYMSQSIYMNVDPYNLKTAVISFVIESDKDIEVLTQMYSILLTDEDFLSAIGEALGITDIKYVRELVIVDKPVVSADKITENGFQRASSAACKVNIICPKEEMFTSVSAIVLDYLNSIKSDLTSKCGTHTLNIVSSDLITSVDRKLASNQLTESNNLASTKTNADKALKELTATQKTYYDMAKEGSNLQDAVITSGGASFSKKYPALGFILGAFIVCAWIACKAIFSSKLQNKDELESYYHLRMLGSFESQRKYRGLDKLFYNLRHCREKKLSKEERLEIISSNIALLCNKNQLKEVSITGTCILEANRPLFEAVAESLKNKGIEASVEESIIYNTLALRNVAATGVAVIMEQVDVSSYKEIANELSTFKSNDITLLGCVGME